MNDSFIKTASKILSVEKAVNIAFITVLTISVNAIQQSNYQLSAVIITEYVFVFLLLYISIPLIKAITQYIKNKLGVNDDYNRRGIKEDLPEENNLPIGKSY